MLSRNSSTSSSVRPSYSNTSTSLHRSTSSVGANNQGKLGSTMSSNNLAPSTGKRLRQIDMETVAIHNEETFSIHYIYIYLYFIAYADSGCCTSPRPESTQSTVSTRSAISNSTKMQNGYTTSKEEPVLNGKDDIHDDRVPCEFCGELRCKETIMRHQVCNLFGK